MSKKLRILLVVMKRTRAGEVLSGFVFYTLATALLIWLVEPQIDRYQDGLWYCYSVITTVGLGDVVVTTFVGKALSVLLSIYAILALAIVTGVVVNLFTELNKSQRKESLALFMDQLERLPELTKEELEQLSGKIRELRK